MSAWRGTGLEWVSFGVDMVDTSGASVEISRRDRQLVLSVFSPLHPSWRLLALSFEHR
jgi:hypothetical protein